MTERETIMFEITADKNWFRERHGDSEWKPKPEAIELPTLEESNQRNQEWAKLFKPENRVR